MKVDSDSGLSLCQSLAWNSDEALKSGKEQKLFSPEKPKGLQTSLLEHVQLFPSNKKLQRDTWGPLLFLMSSGGRSWIISDPQPKNHRLIESPSLSSLCCIATDTCLASLAWSLQTKHDSSPCPFWWADASPVIFQMDDLAVTYKASLAPMAGDPKWWL